MPEPSSGVDFAEDVFVDVKFPTWFKPSFMDLREDLEEAVGAGKQGIMLFIGASRCSYCKAFVEYSLQDPATRKQLTDNFDVIGLDVFDGGELTAPDGRRFRAKEFMTLHRASYTPTLIFFGEGGRVLLRIVGYYLPDRFRRALDYLDARAYLHQPLRAFLQAGSEARETEPKELITDDLFEKPPHILDRSLLPAKKPLLILFERPACEACERFHQRVLHDESIRRLIGAYEAVQLDGSDEHGGVVTPGGEKTSPAGWYRRLGLSYFPSVLFFDEQGREVLRLDSETLRFRMEGSLQLVLERAYEQGAQLQRWRRAKTTGSIQRRRGGNLVAEVAARDALTENVRTTSSCETNLTCAKNTKAALVHEFSSGPDLSRWRRVPWSVGGTLPMTAVDRVPSSLQDLVTGMKLVLIPGACYRSDGADGQPKKVCLDPYYIGAYEVTFEEYDRFARTTGRKLPEDEGWGRGRRPAINVSVYDALNFVKWLSRRTGAHYRLPTEFEWEHAARAGNNTAYPWGNDLGTNRANCNGCGSQWDDEETAPVGSFPPNLWGLYDVVGNVGEWTCSMRDPDPAHSFERCDSIYETRRRAYRNGGWSDDAERITTAFRDWNVAMRRTDDVGFRLVRECSECKVEPTHPDRDRVARQALR